MEQCVEAGSITVSGKLYRTCKLFLAEQIYSACTQDSLDLASMYLHSRPLSDSEDLLPTCYRCGSSNPLVNPQVLSLLTCTLQLQGCFAFGNAIVTHKCLWPIN